MKRPIRIIGNVLVSLAVIALVFVAGAGWATDHTVKTVKTKPQYYEKPVEVKYPPIEYMPGHEGHLHFVVRSA